MSSRDDICMNADGDYETSSEGPLPVVSRKAPRNFYKMDPKVAQDETPEDHGSTEETSLQESSCSQENVCLSSVLTKSESMPVLKISNEDGELSLTSESSLARQRKMKMIVARMDPRLSSRSILSTDVSRADIADGNFEAKKIESRTVLPVIRDPKDQLSTRSKEVTFRDVSSDKRSKKREPSTSKRDKYSATKLDWSQQDGDLIDIAENPHPSIKSFYFPPTPQKGPGRKQSRVTKDIETLLRIDGELGPLQHQLSEITGKFRALNLTDISVNVGAPFLRGQKHYSKPAEASGYYLHQASTFGRDSKDFVHVVGRQAPTWDYLRPSSDEVSRQDVLWAREANSNGTNLGNESLYSLIDPRSYPSVTVNDSFVQLGDKDPSGSLIPCVSSSCYRCHRNRAHASCLDEIDPETSISNLTGPRMGKPGVSRSPGTSVSSRSNGLRYQPHQSRQVEDQLSQQTLYTSTNAAPEVHMISVNTELCATLKEHYANGNCFRETKDCMTSPVFFKNEDSSFHCPRDQSVSTSFTVIGSDGSNKTRYVNYTRVNSQTSLIISKKDQANTKKHRDVQCSGINLKYREKEVVLRRSVESFLRPSESEETNTSKSSCEGSGTLRIQKAKEKVVIVPILFTDEVPEPPKIPCLNLTSQLKRYVSKTNHRAVSLEKGVSSLTQSSVVSGFSAESSCLNQKLTNRNRWNSGMSVSSVSRHASHLSSAIKTLSEYCHGTGSTVSGNTQSSRTRRAKKVTHGMRSSPEDFLYDT